MDNKYGDLSQEDRALYAERTLRQLREVLEGSDMQSLQYVVELAYDAATDWVKKTSAKQAQ